MNFADYLNHQKAEDRRAFIIHYPPCSGKTHFARQITKTRPRRRTILQFSQIFRTLARTFIAVLQPFFGKPANLIRKR